MNNITAPLTHFTRVLTLSLLASACGGTRQERRTAPTLAPEVASRGATIYFGSVFPLSGPALGPTYVYERRVERLADGRSVSTHITRDPSGEVQLAESAIHDAQYGLAAYTLHANQLGQSGRIEVANGRLTYRVANADGELRTEVEEVSDPVVVGPTLVGFIVRHLDALAAGESFVVRMAILDRLETLGFRLSLAEGAAPGLVRVRMKPTSFLVGLVVDPIDFDLAPESRKLVRLQGRVPPKVWAEHSWKDFDARVEYQFVAERYL